MRHLLACGTAAALLGCAFAEPDIGNIAEVCGNPRAAPADIVSFCRKALDSGQLDGRATAQVNANLGVGYFELGDYESALEAYSAALAHSPEMVPALVNRARAYERLDRPTDAVADYNRAIELDPRDADAYLGRGAMLLKLGDPQLAVADFTAAVKLEPNRPAPRFNRGLALLATGQHADALRDFSEVVERSPEDAAAWVNLGRARAGLNMPGAAADFDRAIELEPDWGGAWFARGQFRDATGRRDAANSDFLRAYELGHPDPWLVERVGQISG